jgi:chromosome segregation ATPase
MYTELVNMDDTVTIDTTAIERRRLCLEINSAQHKFDKASVQIRNLKRTLREIKHRYKMADKQDDERIRGNMRIRIMVLKGMLYVYHEYACLKRHEVLERRMELCIFNN